MEVETEPYPTLGSSSCAMDDDAQESPAKPSSPLKQVNQNLPMDTEQAHKDQEANEEPDEPKMDGASDNDSDDAAAELIDKVGMKRSGAEDEDYEPGPAKRKTAPKQRKQAKEAKEVSTDTTKLDPAALEAGVPADAVLHGDYTVMLNQARSRIRRCAHSVLVGYRLM